MTRRFADVEEAIQALATGRMIIVLDSAERENEGDLLLAAEKTTPEQLYFMLRRGCGQLCVPVGAEIAHRLDLTLMGGDHTDPQGTAFAVPVDHRSCRTGISPEERVLTIQALLDPTSRPEDFVRPGHVFPLLARVGGVLRRPGHTEAAVDLARLAGLAPAGVLCEVCSTDGVHMAGRDELLDLADRFVLPILTIDELIRFQLANRAELPVWPAAVAAAV
jgi:3,4-dihydroxy 2-butanone 4-phosphate synthase / GTP cyclohydrolase II